MYSGNEPDRAEDGVMPYSEVGVADGGKVALRGSCAGGYCAGGGWSAQE
jgi:hypothetical protein